jgi:PAS domain S-box-containing protein
MPPPPPPGEAWFHAVLDSVASHIAVLDRGGTIVMVNEAWRRFALENGTVPGRPAARTDVGTNYLAICAASVGASSEGASLAAEGIRAVLDGRRPSFSLEYPCHSPDRQRWFQMAVTALETVGGGAVVTHTGITERRLAEEALRASEARLKLALAAARMGVWEWNVRTDEVFWSPECYDIFGATPKVESLSSFTDLLLPEEADRVMGLARQAVLDHTVYAAEFRIRRPDGAMRWIANVGSAEYDAHGAPLRLLGTAQDITDRKQIEQALQESEVRYRAVVEDQTEVICRFRCDGTILFANEIYCRRFGRTHAELIGARWQPLVHAEEVPLIEARLAELAPDHPVVVIENRARIASGELRWMQFVNRGFFDSAGRIAEIQSVGRDITERKLAEDRQRTLLEQNIRLGRELIDLQERERAALARELHDELSQHLTAIRAHAAAIRRAPKSRPEENRTNARAIESCASQIYAVSHRIIEGLRPQILDSAGLPDALAALISDWSVNHAETRATFRCPAWDIAPDSETRIQLFRVTQECLANVARHARAGRVRVYLGLHWKDGRHLLRLVVRDDGVGMVEGTAGMGYGLIAMRERAHKLGGLFGVRTAVGRGVRIAVEVPYDS